MEKKDIKESNHCLTWKYFIKRYLLFMDLIDHKLN